MEKNVNNNSVIIEDRHIDLTPYLGNLDEDSYVISWKSLGYLAEPVKETRITGETMKHYSVLPKSAKYMARFPAKQLYTNYDGLQFVSRMLSNSNFAKANKILFVLYRSIADGDFKPCGVITEEF